MPIYIYFREKSASCKSAQDICTGALYHLNTQKVYLDSVLRVSCRWSYIHRMNVKYKIQKYV